MISSNESMHYLHHILHISMLISRLRTILGLSIRGISESAVVALISFVFHLTTMELLIGSCAYFFINKCISIFVDNIHLPVRNSNVKTTIFIGSSAATKLRCSRFPRPEVPDRLQLLSLNKTLKLPFMVMQRASRSISLHFSSTLFLPFLYSENADEKRHHALCGQYAAISVKGLQKVYAKKTAFSQQKAQEVV